MFVKRWFNHTHSILTLWSIFAVMHFLGMSAVAAAAEKTTMEKLLDPLYLLWLFGTGVLSILAWSLGRNIKSIDEKIKEVARVETDLYDKYNDLSREVNQLLGKHESEMNKGGHR